MFVFNERTDEKKGKGKLILIFVTEIGQELNV
jgi:hypothetical protein